MKQLCVVGLIVFCLVVYGHLVYGLVSGGEYDKYVKIIKGDYDASVTDTDTLASWREGLRACGCELDYVGYKFSFLKGQKQNGFIVVQGILVQTGYCHKGKEKARLVQVLSNIYLFTESGDRVGCKTVRSEEIWLKGWEGNTPMKEGEKYENEIYKERSIAIWT